MRESLNITPLYPRIAKAISLFMGRPSTLLLAVPAMVIWLVTGLLFGFSGTGQLLSNTGTTIITFLMVFLIQMTLYRDTAAILMKLDKLIRATNGAHNAILDLEDLDDILLEKFGTRYRSFAAQARANIAKGRGDIDNQEP